MNHKHVRQYCLHDRLAAHCRPENLLSNRIDRAPRSQRVARAQVAHILKMIIKMVVAMSMIIMLEAILKRLLLRMLLIRVMKMISKLKMNY